MVKIKKLLLITVTVVLLIATVTSCGGKKEGTQVVAGTLDEVMDELYESAGADFEVYRTEVTVDNSEYYLGTADIEFAEALASEPMISAIAHSVVLVRMPENADIEAAKVKIRENVNPRKWICVGVEADKVVVDNIGELILLVMSEDSNVYHEAFLALAK